MASRDPKIRLKSVDFPTFGRPTIATMCNDIGYTVRKVLVGILTEKERRYLVFLVGAGRFFQRNPFGRTPDLGAVGATR
jgi:hypothetical protein